MATTSKEERDVGMMRIRCVQVLIDRAAKRETITYRQLANRLGITEDGIEMSRIITPILTDVYNWCKGRNTPQLTLLVVRKSGANMGMPGNGFWRLEGLERHDDRFKTVWFNFHVKELHDYYSDLHTPQLDLIA